MIHGDANDFLPVILGLARVIDEDFVSSLMYSVNVGI